MDESGAVYFDDVISAASPRGNTVSTFLQHRYGGGGTDGFRTKVDLIAKKTPTTTFPRPSTMNASD